MQKNANSEILIIGAGIIGLACAYYLAKDGHQVTVIDKGNIGSGASHGNCGILLFSHLAPLCEPGVVFGELPHLLDPTSHLYIKLDYDLSKWLWLLRFAGKCNHTHLRKAVSARDKLLRLSRQLYRDLMHQEQLACNWRERGVLMVFKDQAAMDGYDKTNQMLVPFGLGGKRLEKSQVLEMEPALHNQVCGAWYHEQDSHLRPEKLIAALSAVVKRNGVQIFENCDFTGFIRSGGRINAIRTTNGIFGAENLVLTAGAWTPQITRQLRLHLPVQPGKGYSITMNRPEICPRIPCYFHEPRVVATPWKDGLRLGGTMEFSGFNEQIDSARISNLKRACRDYLKPSQPQPAPEEWVGLRPMSPDDLPFIGRAPGWSNLYLACGHGTMGVAMATGTGRAVAELIGRRDPGIDLAAFSPARFKF